MDQNYWRTPDPSNPEEWIYHRAWKIQALPINQEEIKALHCSEENCQADFRTIGGLKNISSTTNANWRCAKHREEHDHSSHRLDLRMATQRAVDAAVKAEQKRILDHLHLDCSGNAIFILIDYLENQLKLKPKEDLESPFPKGD